MTPSLDDLAGPRLHETLAGLRSTDPIAWVPAIGGWLVTSHELARAVLLDADTFTVDDPRFSTAQVVGPSMLSLDGPEHQRHRDAWVEHFRLRTLGPEFQRWASAEAARRVSVLAPSGRAEMRTALAGPFAVATISHLLGLGDGREAELLGWYRAIVDSVTGIGAGLEPTSGGAEAMAALADAVDEAVASAEPEASILSSVSAGGQLSRDELVSDTAVLLFGAIETGEGMTANALWHLLSLDGHERDSPGLLDGLIRESARFEPAAAVVDRYATADCMLGGASIKDGDFVQVSLAGANHDLVAFGADSDRLIPSRSTAGAHLAFAVGPHACLGLHVAKIETLAAVQAVHHGLPGVELVEAESLAPEGLVFRKALSVEARWPLIVPEGPQRVSMGS